MNRIHRHNFFPQPDAVTEIVVHMPAHIVGARAIDNGTVDVWFEEDLSRREVTAKLRVVATGEPFDGTYVGIMHKTPLVFHLIRLI